LSPKPHHRQYAESFQFTNPASFYKNDFNVNFPTLLELPNQNSLSVFSFVHSAIFNNHIIFLATTQPIPWFIDLHSLTSQGTK
jgi:hypothetical protein